VRRQCGENEPEKHIASERSVKKKEEKERKEEINVLRRKTSVQTKKDFPRNKRSDPVRYMTRTWVFVKLADMLGIFDSGIGGLGVAAVRLRFLQRQAALDGALRVALEVHADDLVHGGSF
jgi:hypothetical protein